MFEWPVQERPVQLFHCRLCPEDFCSEERRDSHRRMCPGNRWLNEVEARVRCELCHNRLKYFPPPDKTYLFECNDNEHGSSSRWLNDNGRNRIGCFACDYNICLECYERHREAMDPMLPSYEEALNGMTLTLPSYDEAVNNPASGATVFIPIQESTI